MRKRILLAAAIGAAALWAAPTRAQTATLTGFTTWGAANDGTWTGGFWDTLAGGGGWNAYFLDPNTLAPLTSGDTSATLTPNLLVPQNLLYATAAEGNYDFLGINLYFDGSATPGISAVMDIANGTFSSISNLVSTYGLSGGIEAGSGSLSFTNGSGTVSLNAWAFTQVNNNGVADFVGPADSLPDGGPGDNAALLGFTAGGAAAPEPGTLALGLLGLAAFVRRRRR